MNKVLFLDRDGIINYDFGYVYRIDDIVFNFDIFSVCKTAISLGYKIIVITNQSGIAKGLYSEDDVFYLHHWISELFQTLRIPIIDFYHCPFDGSNYYRKPNPGMILQAIEDHDINLKESLMVGDKPSDRININDLRCLILRSKYTGNDYDISEISEIENYL